MEPRYKVMDVVYLNEDYKAETRTQYKIIEVYLQDIPIGGAKPVIVKPIIKAVIPSRRGVKESTAPTNFEYLIEPMTDGADRRVSESDIEGLAE